ncbi:MAG: lyase family protein [Gemmatimonadaceae bacterium]|nr:lyase family protein [Gemmatimonadaceae bacterium]
MTGSVWAMRCGRPVSLPLGLGGHCRTAFPVSRQLLMQELGFAALSQNSIDAVGDRDFIADTLYALTMTATHLSRLAEDLILFGTSEFGFVQFGDAFSTGSSMMPQKRNPDALELTRGSAARVFSDLTSMVMALKGLPSGYNKDLQDDKRALFDAVDVMGLVLPAVAGAVGELTFRTDRMRAAVTSVMMATDLADYLVLKGVTFRESHSAVRAGERSCRPRRRGSSCMSCRCRPSSQRTPPSVRTCSMPSLRRRAWIDATCPAARR